MRDDKNPLKAAVKAILDREVAKGKKRLGITSDAALATASAWELD
jgi:hypothetical protein